MAASWGYIGNGGVAAGNGAVPLPAGIQSGDLLVLLLAQNDNAAGASISGWTQLATSNFDLSAWYKFAGSSESPPTGTGVSSSVAVILAYRTVSELDVVRNSVSTGTNTTPATTGHVTTTATDDLVLSLYTVKQASITWTASLPANTSVRIAANPTSTKAGLLVADEDQAAAGSSATRTAGLSNTGQWGSVTAAFIAKAVMSFSDDLYF
jgi:hypothetical protein